jgi:hypothetical protein
VSHADVIRSSLGKGRLDVEVGNIDTGQGNITILTKYGQSWRSNTELYHTKWKNSYHCRVFSNCPDK